jgi:chorismate synthase
MERELNTTLSRKDSLGGIVGITVQGTPPGLGEPVFDKLDADLSKAMLSIGGVKGVEFGRGFELAEMQGSQANDPIAMKEGRVGTTTNNHGGILGGISTGEEIVLRLVVKPTSSIARPQETIDEDGNRREITVKGRHDPTLCPRIVPVAESMAALVLADHLLRNRNSRTGRT